MTTLHLVLYIRSSISKERMFQILSPINCILWYVSTIFCISYSRNTYLLIFVFAKMIKEPIAIICFHGCKKWSGTIILTLKNPMKDVNDLLQGIRSIILKVDNIIFFREKINQ